MQNRGKNVQFPGFETLETKDRYVTFLGVRGRASK